MDLHVLGNLVCVLLCAVAVVVAGDGCATYGQVYIYNKDCFSGVTQPYTGLINENRGRMCSQKAAILECMVNKTEGCAAHASVMAEVDNSFNVCDGTNISSWVLTVANYVDLQKPETFCRWNSTAREACDENAAQAAAGFPFANKTVSDGLEAVKGMKRATLNCYKTSFKANESCSDYLWKKSYMYSIVALMEHVDVLGIYIEDADKVNITQNENSSQQTSLNVRDLFPGIFS